MALSMSGDIALRSLTISVWLQSLITEWALLNSLVEAITANGVGCFPDFLCTWWVVAVHYDIRPGRIQALV